MKQKYFIQGLGVGILITAILMSIPALLKNTSEKRDENPANTAVSEEPADKAGQGTSAEPSVTKETGTSAPSSKPSAAASAAATTAPGNATKAPDSSAAGQTAAPGSQTQPSSKAASADGSGETTARPKSGSQKVTITKGMDSAEVSEKLEDAGLVEDAGDFNSYLENRGYAEGIRAGEFEIPAESTYEQIANTIADKRK